MNLQSFSLSGNVLLSSLYGIRHLYEPIKEMKSKHSTEKSDVLLQKAHEASMNFLARRG